MIANFYIIPESFCSSSLNDEQFLSSLENFISEYYKIVQFKEENKIIIQEKIYEIILPNGKSLADFIYSDNTNVEGKDLSMKKFLSSVFSKLVHEEFSIDDIKDRIKSNSIDSCYGIISLSKIKDIADENQIVYDKNSWLNFRRYHLGLFFGDAEYFIDECKKYYTELFLHENNYTSTGKILDGFSNKIIFHLSGLNDNLPNLLIKKNYNNHTELLSNFSTLASLDDQASLEGANKDRLKFSFTNKNASFFNAIIYIGLCCHIIWKCYF